MFLILNLQIPFLFGIPDFIRASFAAEVCLSCIFFTVQKPEDVIYSLRQPKFHIIFSQLLFKTKTSFYSPEMMIADSRQRARRQVAMFLLVLNMREVLFEQFHRISVFFLIF